MLIKSLYYKLYYKLYYYLFFTFIKISSFLNILNVLNYIPSSKHNFKYKHKNKYYNIKILDDSEDVKTQIKLNIKMKNLITNVCIIDTNNKIKDITKEFREYIHYFNETTLECKKLWKIILNDMNIKLSEAEYINIVCGISLNLKEIQLSSES